jgi:hypothetical protein
LLVAAAILWALYVVPLWLKRSEYYATELNATRLGQTLRVLAHTTEASEEVRTELNARSIAKKEQEAQRQLRRLSSPTLSLAERRRRAKQVFSLTLLISMTAAFTAYAAGWPFQVVLISAIVATASLAILGRLSRLRGSARAVPAPSVMRDVIAEASGMNRNTVPEVPEPLASRVGAARVGLPTRDALLLAAGRAARSARPEDFEDEKLAVVSQFAAMGHVEHATTGKLNLDEVLKRRRAV